MISCDSLIKYSPKITKKGEIGKTHNLWENEQGIGENKIEAATKVLRVRKTLAPTKINKSQ